MKLMLVSSSEHLKPFFDRTFTIQSVDVIHYENPIKAMDNIAEIAPEVVVFSATDFPRHWKPFAMFMRQLFSRRDCVFVLLVSAQFSEDEADKAEALQVNAILDEDLSSEETLQRIRAVLTRYQQNTDLRRAQRYTPTTQDRVRFAFVNPYSLELVSGRVADVSTRGLRLEPNDAVLADRLDAHATISAGTLRLGDELLDVAAKVLRVGATVAVEFHNLPIETEEQISAYIDKQLREEWVQRGVEA